MYARFDIGKNVWKERGERRATFRMTLLERNWFTIKVLTGNRTSRFSFYNHVGNVSRSQCVLTNTLMVYLTPFSRVVVNSESNLMAIMCVSCCVNEIINLITLISDNKLIYSQCTGYVDPFQVPMLLFGLLDILCVLISKCSETVVTTITREAWRSSIVLELYCIVSTKQVLYWPDSSLSLIVVCKGLVIGTFVFLLIIYGIIHQLVYAFFKLYFYYLELLKVTWKLSRK